MVLKPDSEADESGVSQLRQNPDPSGFSAEHLGHLMAVPSLSYFERQLYPHSDLALYIYIRIKKQNVILEIMLLLSTCDFSEQGCGAFQRSFMALLEIFLF